VLPWSRYRLDRFISATEARFAALRDLTFSAAVIFKAGLAIDSTRGQWNFPLPAAHPLAKDAKEWGTLFREWRKSGQVLW